MHWQSAEYGAYQGNRHGLVIRSDPLLPGPFAQDMRKATSVLPTDTNTVTTGVSLALARLLSLSFLL